MTRLIAFFSVFLLTFAPASAEDAHPTPFDENYEAMAVVDAALAEAVTEHKRLLLVLGANWCHDSRALAHHFESEALSDLIETHYVVRYIDVGFREQNLPVEHRFGVAAIYATPTVFIIDPASETLLNRHSTEYWTTAASRPVEDALAYFTRWIDAGSDQDGLIAASIVYQSMMTEIEVFEAEEGERLASAYADIARWRDLADADRPENFDALDQEVEMWRRRMVRQVRRLREEAERGVTDALAAYADGREITLEVVAGFDQTDPDLPLRIQPHESDVW